MKYGLVIWTLFAALAIRLWKSMRASVDRPEVGELVTTSALVPPLPGEEGKYSGLTSISPAASSQFSENVAASPAAASPSTRTIVSRQRGSSGDPYSHWSA